MKCYSGCGARVRRAGLCSECSKHVPRHIADAARRGTVSKSRVQRLVVAGALDALVDSLEGEKKNPKRSKGDEDES